MQNLQRRLALKRRLLTVTLSQQLNELAKTLDLCHGLVRRYPGSPYTQRLTCAWLHAETDVYLFDAKAHTTMPSPLTTTAIAASLSISK